MKPLVLILLFTTPLLAWSQSDSTQTKVDSVATEVSQKTKAVLLDSLNNRSTLLDSLTEKTTIISKHEQLLKDSIDILPQLPTIDSTAIANDVTSTVNEELSNQNITINLQIPKDSAAIKTAVKQKVNEELSDQLDMDIPDIQFDSTLMDDLSAEGEKRVEEALKNSDEFKGLEGSELEKFQDQMPLSPQELKKQATQKQLKQKMTSHAKQYVSQHADQIQQAQSSIGDLKKIYSSVPNSNDLSTATKRTSLEDEPLGKRLTYGLNFNISGTDPLTIDFSPTIGYRFNTLFELGITGAYRSQFGSDNINNFDDSQVYGYSVYVNHSLYRSFFGYVEGEHLSRVSGTAENSNRAWQPTLLAGIGRRMKISRTIEMQAIITYNFLHENNDGVYDSPVVFKTGVRVVR